MTLAVDMGSLDDAGEGETIDEGVMSGSMELPFGLVWFTILTSGSTDFGGETWISGNPLTEALEGGVGWGEEGCCVPLGAGGRLLEIRRT